ncbi:MAG: hypothetical protein JEZ08_14480 [Clostridiales bacterium]|nr:hypothetical protein [Clostridiales bacterium]
MERDKNSSGFAVFIILIGISILLINFDILRLSMFWGVAHLWPLLLIIAGLSILFRRIRYFNVVLWLIFFGIVIGYSYLNMDEKSWFFGDTVEMVYQEKAAMVVTKGMVDIDMRQGTLDIGTNTNNIISYNVPNVGIEEKTIIDTGILGSTELIVKDKDWDDLFNTFQNRKYEISLPNHGEWTFDIDGAVIDGMIDLSDLKVESFKLDYAVGDIDLFISDKTSGVYVIDFAVGDIMIDVPESVGVKLIVDGAIKSIDVPNDFSNNDSTYYSSNYDDASEIIEIRISLAIGNIEIK